MSTSNPAYSEPNNAIGKWWAYPASILFHPLFVPLYVVSFLLYIHPDAFIGFSSDQKIKILSIVFLNLVFFPLFTVLLAKALGFIDSIYLHTQKDRIIPLIACGIFFFWGFLVFKKQHQYPAEIVAFLLGVFLTSSAGLIANIYQKVSLHAMGMGGWLGFFIALVFDHNLTMAWPLAVVSLLTGLVCSARLSLRSHTQQEVYIGVAIGLVCQWVAAFFY